MPKQTKTLTAKEGLQLPAKTVVKGPFGTFLIRRKYPIQGGASAGTMIEVLESGATCAGPDHIMGIYFEGAHVLSKTAAKAALKLHKKHQNEQQAEANKAFEVLKKALKKEPLLVPTEDGPKPLGLTHLMYMGVDAAGQPQFKDAGTRCYITMPNGKPAYGPQAVFTAA